MKTIPLPHINQNGKQTIKNKHHMKHVAQKTNDSSVMFVDKEVGDHDKNDHEGDNNGCR